MTINEIGNTSAARPAKASPAVVITQKLESSLLILHKNNTVHITSAARAKSMQLEGLSVAQIAMEMGLDTDTIWTFLQKQPAVSASLPATPAT